LRGVGFTTPAAPEAVAIGAVAIGTRPKLLTARRALGVL
jgi:hypothetical protein